MSRWIYGGLLLILLGSGYAYWQHNHKQPETITKQDAPAAIPVRIVQVKLEDTPVFMTGIGNVTALNQVVIRSRVDGELTHINFKEGQSVKAGDVLAELDDRAIKAELARAEAEKASNQAQLTNAQLNLKRYNNLLKDDAIARQTVDQEQANVQQLQAAVQMADAAIKTAHVQLSYTRITAPISGYVGIRNIDIGNIVRAADTNGLLTITQITPITILFSLPQTALPDIVPLLQQTDRPVEILAKQGDTILAKGQLQAIDNQIDSATGTVRLKAVSPNKPQTLWPGQFVVVRLQTKTLRDKIVVPLSALQRKQDRAFVYRLTADNKAEQVDIKVLFEDKDKAVIDGPQSDDRIVVDGQSRLKPNSNVIINDDPDNMADKTAAPDAPSQ